MWPGPARGLWVKKAEAGSAPALVLAATPQTANAGQQHAAFALNSILPADHSQLS